MRFGRTFWNRSSTATFEALPENMVKVTIPTKVSWKPGQHFFVRFLNLGIHAATSHPFTVATLCSADEKDGHVIELYSRTHGGITGRLAAVAQSGALKASAVMLDGPYGGLEGNLKVYDRAILLAGGSGLSFMTLLPISQEANIPYSCRRHIHCAALPRPPALLR